VPALSTADQLAEHLGWPGRPHGDDAEALALLLEDELERLKAAPHQRFLERLREVVPGAIGSQIVVCEECSHTTLARYASAACRGCGKARAVSSEDDPDSGFGFVLSDYGTKATASVLDTPAAKAPAPNVEAASDRALAKGLKLDADNLDWDDLQAEIAAHRERVRLAGEAEALRIREAAEAEQRRIREAAEAAERKRREEAEAAERKRREEEERKQREEEERKRREEAERERQAAAERNRLEEEERQRIARLERRRPALGCVMGVRAGDVIRIPDDEADPETGFYVLGGNEESVAHFVAPEGSTVDGKPVTGDVVVAPGSVVVAGHTAAYVVEETGEVGAQVAETIHLARNDKKPGGPWPFWNEEIKLGALSTCDINVVDDGVADVHARMFQRFGVVVLEDLSGRGADDDVFVNGERRAWALLGDGVSFRLGPSGPELIAKKGAARQKAGQKAKAMKPARHNRTVLDVYDSGDELIQRVIVFVRREVRFGAHTTSPEDETRLMNEWALIPTANDAAEIGDKQGALALTREGVDLRRDGGAEMSLNGDDMEAGKPHALKRSFDLLVGEDLTFEGRVYRSPSAVDRDVGPARLGMKGGHPVECVRLDRSGTDQTYVFLVRTLRIGSETFAPLRLDFPGVVENHCQIMFSQGKYLIVSPREPVLLGDVELDPGVAFPLQIDTDIRIGDARLRFREVNDADFLPG
jgi:hypothetical protein